MIRQKKSILPLQFPLKLLAEDFEHKNGENWKATTKDINRKVVKVCNMNGDEVHNISEERTVAITNHEVSIRERNLDSVKRKLILNRLADLLQDNSASFSSIEKTQRCKRKSEFSGMLRCKNCKSKILRQRIP